MIYLALPSPDDRAQILKTVIKRTPLAPDVDIEKLARDVRMNGYRYIFSLIYHCFCFINSWFSSF